MPNKRKMSKLATKMLISGKMKANKDVQNTIKYLERKSQIDNEDINFDFEDVKNDFGKLEANDDDTRKLKRTHNGTPKTQTKKLKAKPNEVSGETTLKKAKLDETPIEKKTKSNALPKKSIHFFTFF